MQHHAVVMAFGLLEFFAVPDQHAPFAQMIGQRIGDLVIEKLQQLIPRVDQVDFDPQVAKYRGVLATDHAGAVNRNRLRSERQIEDRLAVENARMTEVDVGRSIGTRPDGKYKRLAAKPVTRLFFVDDVERMRVDKTPLPAKDGNMIAFVKSLPHFDL